MSIMTRRDGGQIRNDVSIVGPDQIGSFDYDFIIIGSQFNNEIYSQLIQLGINRTKVFQYYVFMDNFNNYYQAKIKRFLETNGDVEALATGISYAARGFREEVCSKKAFNFAFGSQDLFYDYQTVKYLLERHPDKTKKISHVFIGLCYYSFQYDMSLSAMKNKTLLYYPVLQTAHHYPHVEQLYSQYQINKKIADKLFRRNEQDQYDFKWRTPALQDYENKWK